MCRAGCVHLRRTNNLQPFHMARSSCMSWWLRRICFLKLSDVQMIFYLFFGGGLQWKQNFPDADNLEKHHTCQVTDTQTWLIYKHSRQPELAAHSLQVRIHCPDRSRTVWKRRNLYARRTARNVAKYSRLHPLTEPPRWLAILVPSLQFHINNPPIVDFSRFQPWLTGFDQRDWHRSQFSLSGYRPIKLDLNLEVC